MKAAVVRWQAATDQALGIEWRQGVVALPLGSARVLRVRLLQAAAQQGECHGCGECDHRSHPIAAIAGAWGFAKRQKLKKEDEIETSNGALLIRIGDEVFGWTQVKRRPK